MGVMATIEAPASEGARTVEVASRDNAPSLTVLAVVAVVGAGWLRVAGLPGADLHGPLHRLGIMDPLCGGTRATYLLVRGDLLGAWSWNPLVPLLAVGLLAVATRFLVGRLSGRWVNLHIPRRVWIPATIAAFLVLEVNQQLQADRLINVVPT